MLRWAAPAALLAAAACAPAPVVRTESAAPAPPPSRDELHETPVPDGEWRGHRLARCGAEAPVPAAVERELGFCSMAFRGGSGSDGMAELEITMAETGRHPLVLLTLGQLYLLAGQGDPALLPHQGPAADTEDWSTNRPRLLGRARALLEEAGRARPDDAAVDYLLADVARACGEAALADSLAARGRGKCTGGRSFDILRQYQQLNLHAAEVEAAAAPEYPAGALERGDAGRVVLDLLLDPAGRVRQVAVVQAPADDLAAAAADAFRRSRFAPGRVGKYPVWCWLRVASNFTLKAE